MKKPTNLPHTSVWQAQEQEWAEGYFVIIDLIKIDFCTHKTHKKPGIRILLTTTVLRLFVTDVIVQDD